MTHFYNKKFLNRIYERRKEIIELNLKKQNNLLNEDQFYTSLRIFRENMVFLYIIPMMFFSIVISAINHVWGSIFFIIAFILFILICLIKEYNMEHQRKHYLHLNSQQADFYKNFNALLVYLDYWKIFYLDYQNLFKQYCNGSINKNDLDLKILDVDYEKLIKDFKIMKNEIEKAQKYNISINQNLELSYLPELMEKDKNFILSFFQFPKVNGSFQYTDSVRFLNEKFLHIRHEHFLENNDLQSHFEIHEKIMAAFNKSNEILKEATWNEIKEKLSQLGFYDIGHKTELNNILIDLEKEIRKIIDKP